MYTLHFEIKDVQDVILEDLVPGIITLCSKLDAVVSGPGFVPNTPIQLAPHIVPESLVKAISFCSHHVDGIDDIEEVQAQYAELDPAAMQQLLDVAHCLGIEFLQTRIQRQLAAELARRSLTGLRAYLVCEADFTPEDEETRLKENGVGYQEFLEHREATKHD